MTTTNSSAEPALKTNIALDTPVEPHLQPLAHAQERRLSAEILSLIEEAFPEPTFASEHIFTFVDEDPPVYNNNDPPQYSLESHGTLVDRLSAPQMSHAFPIRVSFKRITMEPPYPETPIENFSDLMLVSPAMSFDFFLRQVQAKTRGQILASKRRRLPGECMVQAFYVVFRERGQGLLKREKKSKLMIKPSNWAAAVASLRDGKASEIQVKFWTETPGSAAEQTRRERMEEGIGRNMWRALWS
ncbi:hypothetical protein AC578_8525 [Pseudocercospora eumusae]|uniref:Uncharacterized protein n=1 Tax=Pseudocercospora eumusae TaxID=321146 RepID=A0A139HW63_9PEZI|nr:hypothetical protein AC578_8525 [Pseudocercospora eumusae]